MSEQKEIKTKKKKGGKMPGAGRPKGSISYEKKQEKATLEYIKQRVIDAKEKLINAQMNLATGLSFLMCQKYDEKGKKKGKAFIVDNENTIIDYLNGDLDGQRDQYFYMTTKRPDTKAIDSLLNRTVGKPADTLNASIDFDEDTKKAIEVFNKNITDKLVANYAKNNGIK